MAKVFSLMAALLALVVSACGGGSPAAQGPTSEAGAQSTAAGWQDIALRDVRTGETFTFADFAGRTVYVHPMARW